MDESQLKLLLNDFKNECGFAGKPLSNIEIIPFFDKENLYSLQISADWVNRSNCSIAFDFLIEILKRTTTTDCRSCIFEIQLHQNFGVPNALLNTETMIGFRALGITH